MVKTMFDDLPSKEELEVPELLLGSHLLMQTATYLGKYCDDLCKDYMLCKYEFHDPKRCLTEGKKVTACGLEFMNKVKNTCRGELEALTTCVKYTSPILIAEKCREQQAIFDACMYRKMGMDKPPMGFFALTRLHEPDRPPVPEWVPDFPQPAGNIPADRIQKRTRPVTGAPRGYFSDP